VERTDFLDSLRALAEETAGSFGMEIFDLEHRLSDRRWWFRITLDRMEGPVTIEDCERVSRDLSVRLEVEDLIPHAYTLEVSSPGIERPLRETRDYLRFRGREARFVLVKGESDETGGILEGIIEGFEDPEVLVRLEDGEVRRIPLGSVKHAKLLFRFP